MPDLEQTSETTHISARTLARRVLVCASGAGASAFAARLAAAGYEVHSVGTDEGVREIESFALQLVCIEANETNDEARALARDLRAHAEIESPPLVIIYGDARKTASLDESDAARSFAREIGADDCFALATPAPEILARLDSLFWRIESRAEQRARSDHEQHAEADHALATPQAAHERRSEIDDFMRLLDDARARINAGASGALALIAPAARDESDGTERDVARGATTDVEAAAHGTQTGGGADSLRAAHGFFVSNLRRADAVAFYGPDLLLAYLPRRASVAAREDLARLQEEFASDYGRARIAVGVAQFPEDGAEIEELIEHAEAALESARSRDASEPDGDADGTRRGAATLTDRGAHASERPARVLRESRGESFRTSLPTAQGTAEIVSNALARDAAEAAARERERRWRGEPMPRRVLLAVSDPARMAQVNLLLRTASYEVRAAFDGGQALDLLRIERADLLLLDLDLKRFDGLEVLRRLCARHAEGLPLPVLLLHPRTEEGTRARNDAHALGARGFVALPYEPFELLAAVRETGKS